MANYNVKRYRTASVPAAGMQNPRRSGDGAQFPLETRMFIGLQSDGEAGRMPGVIYLVDRGPGFNILEFDRK